MTDIKKFYSSQEILQKALSLMTFDKFAGNQKPKEYHWFVGWIRRVLKWQQ